MVMESLRENEEGELTGQKSIYKADQLSQQLL